MRSNWRILEESDSHLTIEDLDGSVSVTNDAENVVKHLFQKGRLTNAKRMLYWDTLGNLDEILHADGVFMGFRTYAR